MKKKHPMINDTLLELLLGILLYAILGSVSIILIIPNWTYSLVGFIIGSVISAGMVIHMSVELEKSMYMGEHGATKHTRMTTCLRMIVVAALLIAVAWFKVGDIISSLVGVMALKVSAYIQPLTHKVLNKSKRKGR